jgi:hypothetical protein
MPKAVAKLASGLASMAMTLLPSVEYIQARRLVSVVLPTPPLPVIANFIPYYQVLKKRWLCQWIIPDLWDYHFRSKSRWSISDAEDKIKSFLSILVPKLIGAML